METEHAPLQLTGQGLDIWQVESVARNNVQVTVPETSLAAVRACEELVRRIAESGETVYGVTTGIGEFARVRIDPALGEELQRRIIFSHTAGTGDVQPVEVVRAAMLCRLNTLVRGNSGLRESTFKLYLEMLNRGVIPVVLEKGSVGCSGDLSPLAQLAAAVLGEGEAFYNGERLAARVALERAGLEPLRPTFKEGLALINGTQMMAGEAALQLCDTIRLYKTALIAYALALDTLIAVQNAFDPRVHAIRPYPGAIATAAAMRQLWDGSEIMANPSGKVQDGYSMRCTPQVMGASIDTLHFVIRQVETEINSVIDNPLFFADDGAYLAAGNFHGQPLAMSLDFLAIATSEVGSLAERHTNRLLNPALSNGLPDFLTEGGGLNSGLMVSQYTQAALLAENRVLSHPAVVDNVSVSADQEDHVNMGPVSVRKYKEILKNTQVVVAIELLCAAQAVDLRAPLSPGRGTRAAYEAIRRHIPRLDDDRPLHPDVNLAADLVRSGEILAAVEEAVGPINLNVG